MRAYKKGVLVALTLAIVGVQSVSLVQAADYGETFSGSYSKDNPISWLQSGQPYNQEAFAYCSEGTFGYCACGVHTLAYLMLKTGYWTTGKDAMDGYKFAQDKGIGSNSSGTPAYNWAGITAATSNKVKHLENAWFEDASSSHAYIKEQYNKGNFMVLSVKMGGVGHLIAVDYVDANGDIVILDSGRRYKYLKAMDGEGWVRDVHTFSATGKDAKTAPKFWDGEASTGSSSDGTTKNKDGSFPELNDEWKNPVVEYEGNVVKAKDKGLNVNEERGWLSWLFR